MKRLRYEAAGHERLGSLDRDDLLLRSARRIRKRRDAAVPGGYHYRRLAAPRRHGMKPPRFLPPADAMTPGIDTPSEQRHRVVGWDQKEAA
jgi:hypothetical protein